MLLIEKILVAIKQNPRKQETYTDAINTLCTMGSASIPYANRLKTIASQAMGAAIKAKNFKLAEFLYDVLFDTYCIAAPYNFEDFIIALEYNRPEDKQFYLPRRNRLGSVALEMQRLADDELDLLCISLPPGVGKTTLAIFFILWLIGRDPESPILSGSHSTALMRGVYEECQRVATDDEYNFSKIFPLSRLVGTNAQDLALDFRHKRRFSSLQFTSIGSGNAGRLRAMQLLYCDDLVSGIEEAMSKDRLDKLWQSYTVDLKQRKMGTCPELHIATRWSVHDVIGRLEIENQHNDRAKFIVFPALGENEESNFEYKFGVGFSTKNYMDLRNAMDDASWRALYMNEPIEREGLLFPEAQLRCYFEMPQGEPDGIIAVVDTKNTGTDYGFMPVAYLYGDDLYIDDCVCTSAVSEFVSAYLVKVIQQHNVDRCRFESNNAGGEIAKNVAEALRALGNKTNITTAYTVTNKLTRMVLASTWVMEHCLFKDKSLYEAKSHYGTMMRLLTTFTVKGKNKNDDVPDGFAQLKVLFESLNSGKICVFQRPF